MVMALLAKVTGMAVGMGMGMGMEMGMKMEMGMATCDHWPAKDYQHRS